MQPVAELLTALHKSRISETLLIESIEGNFVSDEELTVMTYRDAKAVVAKTEYLLRNMGGGSFVFEE